MNGRRHTDCKKHRWPLKSKGCINCGAWNRICGNCGLSQIIHKRKVIWSSADLKKDIPEKRVADRRKGRRVYRKKRI